MYPNANSAGGYIAATMFLEAVKATNLDISHDAINNALRTLKIDTPAGIRSYAENGLGIGNLYIGKVIKMGDRYSWEPIYVYENIVMDEPK
jgi:ABC-type branched-subunit amino acid transport system substrate-binding protein